MINETPNSNITLKKLRDYIIDNNLTHDDKILLNSLAFDDIILEHRKVYSDPITMPFFFLGVEITEDRTQKIHIDEIKVIRGK